MQHIEKDIIQPQAVQPKRRGRPKKIQADNIEETPKIKKGRGRPKKVETTTEETIHINEQNTPTSASNTMPNVLNKIYEEIKNVEYK